MVRSLEEPRGLGDALRDLLARSVMAGMGKRDTTSTTSNIEGKITDVKTAFSSWDNCMQATFCKWPVIAVIIVGGLIIFSIVWCIIRCACCGVSCCCECCYCLKCCGSCCGMCDSPKKKKYLDEPYVPPHHDQGYRSEAPMTAAHAVPASTYDKPIAKPEPPQYAEFETSKKGGGDELPAMPSWEGGNSKKVAIEDAVELEQLKKPETAQNAPLMGPGAMSLPASPNPGSQMRGNSPYGAPSQNTSGYMTPARSATDPYAMSGMGQQPPTRSNTDPYGRGGAGQQQAYNNYANNGYGQMSRDNVSQGYDQGYGNSGYSNQGYENQGYNDQSFGAAAAATSMGQGRRTPHQDYNNSGYRGATGGQGFPQTRTPRPYDEYGRSMTPATGPSRSNTPGNGYGRPPQGRSPAPPNAPYGNPDRMRSPAPQQTGYDYDHRSNTPNSYGRQYPAAPSRQYSSDSARPLVRAEPDRQYTDASYHHGAPSYQQEPEEPQSPIVNTAGFDFTSGYSRSQAIDASQTPQPPPPPQQANGGGSAYPGYRAYKPQQ
ncbi:hypothetical protein TruAng_007890 [Truncatella angustata]|nr:hypothetical protein TruAng_007890 [Truncatella angustata]